MTRHAPHRSRPRTAAGRRLLTASAAATTVVTTAARAALALTAALGLAACSSSPPVPDWQINAKNSVDRAVAAYFKGDRRVEAREWELAERETARTGRPELLARVVLNRCAAQVASLDFSPCTAFERLRADAAPPERAYADYLAAQASAATSALLPEPHRALAAGTAAPAAAQLAAIEEPFARLVAAGVLLRQARAQPDVLALAADTASQQGWPRALLAWLGVQRRLAEQRGDLEQAARLGRRMDLVAPPPPARPPASAAGH